MESVTSVAPGSWSCTSSNACFLGGCYYYVIFGILGGGVEAYFGAGFPRRSTIPSTYKSDTSEEADREPRPLVVGPGLGAVHPLQPPRRLFV